MEDMALTPPKAPPQGKITFEEFLAWADEDTRAEWEDGAVIMASPASRKHQNLSDWLGAILQIYVRRRKLGELLSAPFLVLLQEIEQGREPDLLFIKTENLPRLQPTYLEGPPDLVVEIVSPESVSRDRGRKFVEYESEGVPEYWLIDPIRRQAEFYQLGQDSLYHPALPDGDGIYHSLSVEGFWINVNWLWLEPLPDELEILGRLGLLQG